MLSAEKTELFGQIDPTLTDLLSVVMFSLSIKSLLKNPCFQFNLREGGEEGRSSTFAALFIINLPGWRNL